MTSQRKRKISVTLGIHPASIYTCVRVCVCVYTDRYMKLSFLYNLDYVCTLHCSYCSWLHVMKYFASSDVYPRRKSEKLGVLILKSRGCMRMFTRSGSSDGRSPKSYYSNSRTNPARACQGCEAPSYQFYLCNNIRRELSFSKRKSICLMLSSPSGPVPL